MKTLEQQAAELLCQMTAREVACALVALARHYESKGDACHEIYGHGVGLCLAGPLDKIAGRQLVRAIVRALDMEDLCARV